MPDLDRDSYVPALNMLTTVTSALLTATDAIDIARMREICGRMETIAPFLEPTAYMRGGMTNLADQAAFLRALEVFVTEVRKLDRRPEGADRG